MMKSSIDDMSQSYHDQDILVIGHMGTLWGFGHHMNGVSLPELLSGGFVDTRKFTL